MKLAHRVSAFFLAALALALVMYSVAFYVLMRNYLYRQFDDDLHSALQILAASVEIEPDDAKWHPAEHGIDLSQHILNQVIWLVCDERDQVVDRSPQAKRTDRSLEAVFQFARQPHREAYRPVEHGPWRLMQTELAAPTPKPLAEREAHEYARLRITVARSHAELDSSMNRLAILVTALPVAVWLAAAGIGLWFVGHALLPVRKMADSARSMTRADFDLRLPVANTRDELSELAGSFNRLLDQLQYAFDRQRRFAGDAAHQLRNPLAVLQGQLDVAMRRPRTIEEYQQTIDTLSTQTAELRQIVESLLLLAHEGNGTRGHMEPVAIDAWLARYAARWANHPRNADLVVQAESRAAVFAPAALLSQILDNLVTNAFNYSSSGTPVTVRATLHDDLVRMTVSDEGIGIAPDEHQAIFEPFFRSTEARRSGVPGTGLGLSVAVRIAAALGGRIICCSAPNRGSIFTLELRAKPESAIPIGRVSST